MKLTLQKFEEEGAEWGILIPADKESQTYVGKLIRNDVITADFKKPRNYLFFRKWWALINYAFDIWQPDDITYKGVLVEKNMETFRKDITILAGRGKPVYRMDGSFTVEAESISFANMKEKEFIELYEATAKVILDNVLTNYSEKELALVLQKLEGFA